MVEVEDKDERKKMEQGKERKRQDRKRKVKTTMKEKI